MRPVPMANSRDRPSPAISARKSAATASSPRGWSSYRAAVVGPKLSRGSKSRTQAVLPTLRSRPSRFRRARNSQCPAGATSIRRYPSRLRIWTSGCAVRTRAETPGCRPVSRDLGLVGHHFVNFVAVTTHVTAMRQYKRLAPPEGVVGFFCASFCVGNDACIDAPFRARCARGRRRQCAPRSHRLDMRIV